MTGIVVSANVDSILKSANYAAIKSLLSLNNVSNVDTSNASNISSGILSDARLSSNVPLLNVANTFTQAITLPNFVCSSTNPYFIIQHTGYGGAAYQIYGKSNGDVALYNGAVDRVTFSALGNLLVNKSTDSGDVNDRIQVTGGVAMTGRLTVGSGTQVQKILSSASALDFGSVAANSYVDVTITVTGCAVGDSVFLGVPNGAILADIVFFAWVSATNIVTIRCANNSSTTARDPASGTFRATVFQF